MSDASDTSSVNEVQTDIATGFRCVICGYILRGLKTTSVCPECGTPIERSAHGDFGDHALSQFIRRQMYYVQ